MPQNSLIWENSFIELEREPHGTLKLLELVLKDYNWLKDKQTRNLSPYLLKAWGKHVCGDLLREKRAKDALSELEKRCTVPVYPQRVSATIRT